VAGDVITGFTPAAPGAAKGFARDGGSPPGPLAFLDALLDLLAAAPAQAGTPASVDAPLRTALENATARLRVPTVDAPPPPSVAGTASTDPEMLLADLFDALAALETATESGQAVDPALLRKLGEALEALVTMPAAPLPIIPAAIAAEPQVADGQLAQPAAIHPASPPAPAPADAAARALVAAADRLVTPREPAATITDAIRTASAAPPPADEPADALVTPRIADGARPAPEPTAAASRLAAKLDQLAAALEKLMLSQPSALPAELAPKLKALAQQLRAGEAGVDTLARLGIIPALAAGDSRLARSLDALLADRPPARPAPQPRVFAQVELQLPAAAQPQKAAPAPAPEPRAPAPPPAPQSTAAPAPEPAIAPPATARTPDRQEPAQLRTFQRETAATARPVAVDPSPGSDARAAAPLPGPVVTPVMAAGTRSVHAAYQAPVQQINMPQVAFEISRQFQAGGSRFQIRLDPPELGRIDVRMEVDKAGTLTARMTVERSETLDLMQRDQRSLERALAQAGLDGSKTNLEFSLRQNSSGQQGQGDGRGHRPDHHHGGAGTPDTDESVAARSNPAFYRGMATASGVNLFV
jgi:flagellar hook-length control protein FliK